MNKLLLGIFLFSLAACHNADSAHTAVVKKDTAYAIIGKVTGLDSGVMVIMHYESQKSDSAVLDHGFFKFSGIADTAELCNILFNGQSKRFFLENGKISMLIKKDSVPQALISGTKTQDEYNRLVDVNLKSNTDQMKEVDKAYEAASLKKNKAATDSLEKLYNSLDEQQKALLVDFVKAHPSSIVSAYEIAINFSYNPKLSKLDSLYSMLDSNVKATHFGRKVGTLLIKEKLTAIGQPAPGFSINDADNNPVTLASFKGTYLLLDFWASWCGPCRQENPNVVKVFHRYKNKKFDIFGVSLDESKEAWVKAVKKDGLDWTQVSELKGWKSDVVAEYGIQGIPMNYLLDTNGIIIAKGLRGEDLEKKLAALLH